MGEVKIEAVSKLYGDYVAVHDLNLSVAQGEFLVMVGPSGCGKTTTLRMLAGLETPSYGNLYVDGRNVTLAPPGKRGVAMVFQSYALYPHMSVYANLAFGLEIRGVLKATRDQKIGRVAELLGLSSVLNRKPAALSGGQRQRVALGRAMLNEPRLFLLDEPLSNLDAALRSQMRTEICELQKRLGVPTVYVTHDQVEAMTMGHRIAVFSHGRLMQVGTPQDVFRHPINVEVAQFIGSPKMNVVRSILSLDESGGFIELLGAKIPLSARQRRALDAHAAQEVDVGIRPHDVHWDKDAPSRCSHALRGTVASLEATGAETFVTVAVAGREIVTKFPAFAPVRAGDVVELRIDADDLHLFDPGNGITLTQVQFSKAA